MKKKPKGSKTTRRRKSIPRAKLGGPVLGRSLEQLVGAETYSVWMKMLKELVPWIRTHRLAVVVTSMLHYAMRCSSEEKNAAKALLEWWYEQGMD